jgi:ubiquinone/menaquinone biosynthesis C-methylase UbiE
MVRTLTSDEARRYYERFALKQDRQGWYEEAALDWLVAHGRFDQAENVLEIGCGTGQLAAKLIGQHMPDHARYTGLDISAEMLRISRERLRDPRARLLQCDATMPLPISDKCVDRLVIAYVLDLLSETEARALINEASRVLASDGLLCLASLSRSSSGNLAWALSRLWSMAQRLAPLRVGGCRPIDLAGALDPDIWHIAQRVTVQPWSVASEALIARRL